MKICHLTSVHKPEDIRIFFKECTYLAQENHEVNLIAPSSNSYQKNSVKVHGISNNYTNRLDRFFRFSKRILQKCEEIDADIYHFHDPELIPVGKKLKKSGKVVFYDIHEDVPRQILTKHWIPIYIRKIISFSFEKYENYSVRFFDALICATPYIRQRFHNLNPMVINVNNYPISFELFSNNNRLKNPPYLVSYIGGISESRGSYAMIKAISKTDAILELAGNFQSDREETELKKHEGWSSVNFYGFVGREEIKNILNRSLAGLVVLEPKKNYVDSLPIKMFEYMAAGVCVIASNFPLWKEIIEGNNCGICVDPLNVEEIAEAIQWVVDNPIEAQKMGENGRRAVEEKYNWERESEKLIQLYNDLEKEIK
ncbi:glycosyltransferase family 4 protein [Virgibacillus sp. MG-45]|uniref:glycosyltransferase family 4 protein n=1 Tax=Virgibacillus sp. MG-45 TaxID=3102791 RepID=UPI002EDB8632